jgi:hypothetical protein
MASPQSPSKMSAPIDPARVAQLFADPARVAPIGFPAPRNRRPHVRAPGAGEEFARSRCWMPAAAPAPTSPSCRKPIRPPRCWASTRCRPCWPPPAMREPGAALLPQPFAAGQERHRPALRRLRAAAAGPELDRPRLVEPGAALASAAGPRVRGMAPRAARGGPADVLELRPGHLPRAAQRLRGDGRNPAHAALRRHARFRRPAGRGRLHHAGHGHGNRSRSPTTRRRPCWPTCAPSAAIRWPRAPRPGRARAWQRMLDALEAAAARTASWA